MTYQEQLKNNNIHYPELNSLNPASCRAVAIQNKYPEFYDWLQSTFVLPVTFSEKLYLFYNNMTNPPTCRICGKPTAYLGMVRGYREFCSQRCMGLCPDIQKRKEETSLKNFGTKHPMESLEVKERLKSSVLSRYGVENPFQSQELMNRAKQTCLEKYGTEYANQSEEVKQKILESKRNRIMKNTPEILEIIDGDDVDIYRMKCHDPSCSICSEKYFDIGSNTLYDRTRIGADICTTRSPLGAHTKNTSLERFVQDILDKHSIPYETNNRTVLRGKELDLYIPDHNLAIECNGVYWHAMYDSEYHYNKWKACSDKGIQLLSIWEDWITNKPEIVRSLILSKLGIYDKKIGARECTIREVDAGVAREFLDANHIQGKCNSKIKLGLYHGTELVSLMVFGYSKSKVMGKDAGWELLRFCSARGMCIIGAASKLLDHFRKMYPGEHVISYSSHDISDGGLYRKLGFTQATETRSLYWYVHNQTHQRYHRTSFTKKELVKMGYDPALTEEQIMMNTDYLRIYDSGLTKWILE